MITGITSTTDSASGANAMKQATGLNKDDFLKLFVAQLQNQDPLNPQDGAQFIAQLAQMTQVEQAYNTNSNLQNLINAQTNTMSLDAVSFIGKDVLAQGSQFGLATGSQPVLNYQLPQAVDQVTLQVFDAAGKPVRTLTAGASPSGQNSIVWDGMDANNQPASAGTYSFSVAATANGQQVAGTPLMQGTVDGVRLDGSTPMLTVGGIEVPLFSVLTVKGG